MLRWIKRRMNPERYQGHTPCEWHAYFRTPQHFKGNLATAVTEALREALGSDDELFDLERSCLLATVLTTDFREGTRCLAAIKLGLDKHVCCESALLAALQDDSELVRRKAASVWSHIYVRA